jgi:hypothetical protein
VAAQPPTRNPWMRTFSLSAPEGAEEGFEMTVAFIDTWWVMQETELRRKGNKAASIF